MQCLFMCLAGGGDIQLLCPIYILSSYIPLIQLHLWEFRVRFPPPPTLKIEAARVNQAAECTMKTNIVTTGFNNF